MANAASTIEIELEIRQAIGRLNNLQKELNQTTQNFNKAADSTRKFEVAIGKAKTAAVAFFSVVTAKKIAEFSDVMTQFENRVKLATNSLNQQIAVQGELIKVAQQTATPLADIGQLYSRMRLAAEQLEASQRDLINLTKTVGLTLKTQGTSATEAAGALQQLGQAFTSPIVQAEEFNSIQDALPALLVQVTKNLGLQQGQLKKYVNDQKLSNKDLFDAILASQKALEEQANLAANTFESFGTRVNNTVTSSIGALSRFMGAKLTKEFRNFKEAIFDTFPALDSFMSKLGKALTIGPGSLDKFTRLVVMGQQPPEEGGGEANLDEIIKDQTNLITDLEASFKGLSIYATTQIMAISEAFEDSNLTLEEYTKKVEAFVKSYTEFYDKVDSGELPGFPSLQFDPETQEQLFLSAEQARKEFELIFKFIAQGFKAFENLNGEAEKYLTYLERITNALSEQLRLLELSEENANRTAGAIVSGISSAGPNASRATNIAQSKTIEEAAAKLILSNEKVAAAIDKSFEILFDTIDPLIDLLGDLISAINRLIGALIEEAGNILEDTADLLQLGPNGYFGSGQFTRDLEANFGGGGRQPAGPTSLELAYAQADAVFVAIEQEASTLEALQPKIDELSSLSPGLTIAEIITRFTDQTSAAVASLEAEKAELEEGLNQTGYKGAGTIMGDYFREEIAKLDEAIADVESKTSIVIEGLISQITGLNEIVLDSEAEIEAINYQNLTERERIELKKESAFVTIEENRALADLIEDQEVRNLLLNEVNQAEEKALELYNLQLSELQKLNEEREREAHLLAVQNIETGLQGLLKDFERTIEKINDLVQGLFDQVNELLFSDFNLTSPQETFSLAQDTYESLLENAFDVDGTEDDIKALQSFVDEYLTAARDIYKSSSAFSELFEGVLSDLTTLGLQYGFNAQIGAVNTLTSGAEDLLGDLPDELQTAVEDLISGLNLATLAFAQQQVEFLTTVYKIDLELDNDDFRIDISVLSLDLGTITPIATAGTPFLGTVTPSVNLDSSSITSAFSVLESSVNDAIDSFITTLQTPLALLGIINLAAGGTFISGASVSSRLEGTSSEVSQFGSVNSIEDLTATYIQSGQDIYPYAVYAEFFAGGKSSSVIRFFEFLDDAQSQYENWLDSTNYYNEEKVGFRRGGLVDPMDTIPAMLSPGEYILSPETVRRYGVSNLNRLNAGDSAALNATSDPEVKRLLAELIVAVKENDTEVNVYTDMEGQTKASIEEFRSELRERTRRQGDKFLPARYI